LAGVLLAGLLAIGCFGGDDDEIDFGPLLTPTPTPTLTATPTSTPAPTATLTATPAATTTATPTPTATATPVATATAIASPAPGARPAPTPAADDLAGVPFSTHDVRLAVEAAGYSFWRTDVVPFCLETAVPGQAFWSANLAGSDFGPVFVLWIYPDTEAVQADWRVAPRERPELLVEGCELPYGFVWWNENAVMAFQVFVSLGEEYGLEDTERLPTEFPAVQAFLELSP
jgi:hypothetical protein